MSTAHIIADQVVNAGPDFVEHARNTVHHAAAVVTQANAATDTVDTTQGATGAIKIKFPDNIVTWLRVGSLALGAIFFGRKIGALINDKQEGGSIFQKLGGVRAVAALAGMAAFFDVNNIVKLANAGMSFGSFLFGGITDIFS